MSRPVFDGIVGAVASCALLVAAISHAQPVTVRVERQGEEVVIEAEVEVAATANHVWAVLTDYDNMARYTSALKSSSVLHRSGNVLQVAQAGEQKHGPFRVAFESVRSVELVPGTEIRTRLVSGSLKRSESTTRVVAQGASTLIIHRGRYVPGNWLPPLIGPAVIQDKTTRQYEELIAEMTKRQQAATEHKAPTAQ